MGRRRLFVNEAWTRRLAASLRSPVKHGGNSLRAVRAKSGPKVPRQGDSHQEWSQILDVIVPTRRFRRRGVRHFAPGLGAAQTPTEPFNRACARIHQIMHSHAFDEKILQAFGPATCPIIEVL